MPLVSVTRFRVRSLRAIAPFLRLSWRSFQQAVRTPGYLDGRVIPLERVFVFWTMTMWNDDGAMRAFRNDGAHLDAMRQTSEYACEMAYVTWQVDMPLLPDWMEGHERLARDGRFTKLRRPSRDHEAHIVRAPWTFLSTNRPLQAALKAARNEATARSAAD